MLLIPSLGIGLPLITGLINARNFSEWKIRISFLYTIGIAFIIWQSNRHILFTLRPYFDRVARPLRKIGAMLLVVLTFTIPVATILMTGWFWIFQSHEIDWKMLELNVILICISAVIITPLYEILFLIREASIEIVNKNKLKDEKTRAELEAIKSQIDPHFIFNALNNLSYLIETDSERAKKFNITLARVYLYILQNKDIHLVPLGSEIQFLEDYFYLARIRFESTILLQVDVHADLLKEKQILSISLQLLLENAIKHNRFSDTENLVIKVFVEGDYIIVHNRKQHCHKHGSGHKIGLANLDTRSKLITGYPLLISETDADFFVSLRLLEKN